MHKNRIFFFPMIPNEFSSGTMSIFSSIFFIPMILYLGCLVSSGCEEPNMHHQFVSQAGRRFQQVNSRFWEYREEFNSWVEVELPYDLVSCINGNCTRVTSIQNMMGTCEEKQMGTCEEKQSTEKKKDEGNSPVFLPLRKRVSLTKMSDGSIWVTGESGSIYERFWNGLQWVIAPHDLPVSAGHANSVFIINQRILALSEAGVLYQMEVTEDSKPIWVEFMPVFDQSTKTDESSGFLLTSGVISHDRERMFFCTKNGSLLELIEVGQPRWINHGRPPGADVAAIVDAASIRSRVIFTVSAAGDLYEYDQNSKPPWKKHIWGQGFREDASLAPARGCSLHGVKGAHSVSLFLLTKGRKLVERQLRQRKWKWVVHGNPKGHPLSSITCASQDEFSEDSNSLFLTTAAGFVFKYTISSYPGSSQDEKSEENWVNHMHPTDAKAARGIPGVQFQVGRIIFPLDDGRLAELHLSGLGGENSGPSNHINIRRKTNLKYVWSILDAPESEGWNTEYCTEERGPSNCIMGTKDEVNELTHSRSTSRRRKDSKTPQYYIPVSATGRITGNSAEEYDVPDDRVSRHFRLRMMQGGKSFFLITDDGFTFEYLNSENVWFWLRHEHSTAIRAAVGNYNGSLFLVDDKGALLIRERSGNELSWMNCSALMRKARQVIGGPPWDYLPGKLPNTKPDDAIFFVSTNGRLLQFTVAMRKFRWKDCRSPQSTKIACIVDQEVFRENIVFVIGRNGRLYQYNKVTGLWHEHSQSQHLILSRSPGTAVRSSTSLKGSLFMLSQDGGLVEYKWNSLDGWNWVEHGTPSANVTLVGSPGPCFEGSELFLIGSDGNMHMRYLDDEGSWKWRNCGFPNIGPLGELSSKDETCLDKKIAADFEKIQENLHNFNQNCDPKVAMTRPIPFAEDSVIFELRDARLAEMRRIGDKNWVWSRTIATPVSVCMANFWTSLAS